jgi:hypothetical protein
MQPAPLVMEVVAGFGSRTIARPDLCVLAGASY